METNISNLETRKEKQNSKQSPGTDQGLKRGKRINESKKTEQSNFNHGEAVMRESPLGGTTSPLLKWVGKFAILDQAMERIGRRIEKRCTNLRGEKTKRNGTHVEIQGVEPEHKLVAAMVKKETSS